MSNTLIMKGLVISSANSTCVLWFVRNDFLSSVSWENCRACHYQMPHISHISSRYWAQSAGGTYESCYCRWELSGQRQTDRTDRLNRQTEHSWHVWGLAEVWWGEPAQASPARVICVVTAWEWGVSPPSHTGNIWSVAGLCGDQPVRTNYHGNFPSWSSHLPQVPLTLSSVRRPGFRGGREGGWEGGRRDNKCLQCTSKQLRNYLIWYPRQLSTNVYTI